MMIVLYFQLRKGNLFDLYLSKEWSEITYYSRQNYMAIDIL